MSVSVRSCTSPASGPNTRMTGRAGSGLATYRSTSAFLTATIGGRAYQRHVLGIKYLLNPNTALKLEANRTREVIGEEKSYNEARAQFAVRF